MNDFATIHMMISAIHWVPLMIAALVWPHKAMRWRVLGVLNMLFSLAAGLIVLVCALALMDTENLTGHGTSGTFYLIYALVSLGTFPLVLIGIHFYFGRFVGWVVRRHIGSLADIPTGRLRGP